MKDNLPLLRAEWLAAERAWRGACAAEGVSIYADAAEGRMTGRGAARQPDRLKTLFDAAGEARAAYFGGRVK